MSKFERMNKSDFINYIVERHSPNFFLKFFSKKKYAFYLTQGYVCVSTAAYMRSVEEGPRRDQEGDRGFKVKNHERSKLPSGNYITINLPDENNDCEIDIQDHTAFLMYCVFAVGEKEETRESLKAMLMDDNKSFGNYCVVIPRDEFVDSFKTATFERRIKEDGQGEPKLKKNWKSGKVEYKDDPANTGFEKLPSFKYQQEFRFVNGFDIEGMDIKAKCSYEAQFLYEVKPPKGAKIIEII